MRMMCVPRAGRPPRTPAPQQVAHPVRRSRGGSARPPAKKGHRVGADWSLPSPAGPAAGSTRARDSEASWRRRQAKTGRSGSAQEMSATTSSAFPSQSLFSLGPAGLPALRRRAGPSTRWLGGPVEALAGTVTSRDPPGPSGSAQEMGLGCNGFALHTRLPGGGARLRLRVRPDSDSESGRTQMK